MCLVDNKWEGVRIEETTFTALDDEFFVGDWDMVQPISKGCPNDEFFGHTPFVGEILNWIEHTT